MGRGRLPALDYDRFNHRSGGSSCQSQGSNCTRKTYRQNWDFSM